MSKKEIKDAEVKEVKAPKKTKGEINKEIRAGIAEENASRTDRNRAEKAARREAKAARKEANVVEEKKKKINNGVLAIMIFGVIALMFVSVWGYKYFSKDASIESYLAKNAETESYSNIPVNDHATADLTAEKNHMKLVIKSTEKSDKQYYNSENGEKEMKYISSYFLTTIRPNVRGLSADVTCTAKVKGKKVNTIKLSNSEAEDFMEDFMKSATEAGTEE